ncbi:probable receptor-like protein kinase At2g42960 isoform X2 [Momordica charantia]|uniref:non-specific serine/threonine protein kinase n=1 Tax=Momordica charantia TaxID=3673 RepID=A0A6J1DQ17_MOMCH|nr:probable receptor-like protein kinase At2g42960 isoform X2 [Momordica charantia]
MASDLNTRLSKKTNLFGLQVWELIGIGVGLVILSILCLLSLCLTSLKKKSKKPTNSFPLTQIPTLSKEIKAVEDNITIHMGKEKSYSSESGSFLHPLAFGYGSQSGDEGSSGTVTMYRPFSSSPTTVVRSPLAGLPNVARLGWGYWFTLRELDLATNLFSQENVIGEGGYGVVYRGCLLNGTPVAVKKILNSQGQAEKEFRAEVEAIGHVRHKNLVRLLGYCIEGTHRMLVYEYVNNGSLELWLHGGMGENTHLTWDARMKIMLGTAKGLAYLHEAIEPKVVHRDIKASNILIDENFNAKLSDFGLAKLMDAGKTHVTTRVMGTFGYVAPEYANTGLLNEKSDVYSFGVVLVETITGRDPVDYERPPKQVNVVDWLKMMIGSRRCEEVVDPKIGERPSTRGLKRVLLVALRCVDPDFDNRPKMAQVVRMLESHHYSSHSHRPSS